MNVNLKQSNQTIENLESEFLKYSNEIGLRENKINELNDQKEWLKNRLMTVQKDYKSLENDIKQKYEKELSLSIVEKNEKLDLEEKIQNLNEKINQIEKENKQLKLTIINDEEKNRNLKHYINDLELKIKNLDENKICLKKKINRDSAKMEKLTFLDKSLHGNLITEFSYIKEEKEISTKNYFSQKKKFSHIINPRQAQSILDIQNQTFNFKKKKKKK